MKATLKNYRQAPRKVRLLANAIKGKTVARALAELDCLTKRAALPMKKLLLSAVANAGKDFKTDNDNLLVKEVRVDQGTILKRMMPRARGSSAPIHKHTSHVMLELSPYAEYESGDNSYDNKSEIKKNEDNNKIVDEKEPQKAVKKQSKTLRKKRTPEISEN